MGRPRSFEIDDAEAALLDVFWSKGYEGSAVRDLCTATGLRPASLYAAFGDKDQMFQAALGRYLTWIEGHLTPPEDSRDGVRHVLETTCRLTLADRERRGCAIINAVADRENLSPEANATVQESFDPRRRRPAPLVAQLSRARGFGRSAEPAWSRARPRRQRARGECAPC